MSEHATSMFQSAVFRLTVWYVSLVMVLSLLFSVMLYVVASNEFRHAFEPSRPGEAQIFLNTNQTPSVREQRINESNGRLVVTLIIFNLTVLAGGTAISYWLARRTLAPIELAHEAQTRFASDAAHELRTPLAAMQSEIEVSLRDKKATREQYKTILKSNLEEVGRLHILTNQLLQLASQKESVVTEFDVEQAAMEAVTCMVTKAQQKKMGIENTIAPAKVLGNFEQTKEILIILLDNAVKYSPERTTVTLHSSVKDTMMHIMVQDEGHGVAEDEQDKIFDRFYRADHSRSKTIVEGHGLGLSLARRLAEEQHGRLTVYSDGKTGSTFTLSLPISK